MNSGQNQSMSIMDDDTVLTTKEAVEYLRISKVTLLKYIRLERVKAVKAGRGWKIYRSELRRFLNGESRNSTTERVKELT